MKFTASEIDNVVLTVIRKSAEVILNVAGLDELSPKADMGKKIADYEKRIAECNEQRQRYYESFIQREIDHAEYLKLKNECSEEIARLSERVAVMKAEARAREAGKTTLALAKRSLDEFVPHKEIVDALVDKILLFPDKRIEIVWKVSDFAAQ